MNKQYKLKTIALALGSVLSLMGTSSTFAAAVTAPTADAFTTGTAASATEVNAKFTEVVTAVNTNAGETNTNATNIGGNATNIGTNTTNIGDNATDIGTNTAAVGLNTAATGANATSIGTNATDIGALDTRVTANANTSETNGGLIGDNAGDIATNTTAISALSSAGVSAATPVAIDCSSYTAGDINTAIATASPVGQLVITLTGACTDNIIFNRDNVKITGGSIDALDDTQATIGFSARGTQLTNITVTGGIFNIAALDGSVVTLNSVATSDSVVMSGLPFSAVGVFANANSTVILESGNMITGGAGNEATDSYGAGLAALANSSIRLTGSNNHIDAEATNTSVALEIVQSSTFVQEFDLAGNQFNGEVALADGSSMFLQQIAVVADEVSIDSSSNLLIEASTAAVSLTVDEIHIETNSSMTLEAGGTGSVTVAVSDRLELEANSSLLVLDFVDDSAADVTVTTAKLRLDTGSIITMGEQGSDTSTLNITSKFEAYGSGVYLLGKSVFNAGAASSNNIGMGTIFTLDGAGSTATATFGTDTNVGASASTFTDEGELNIFGAAQIWSFNGTTVNGTVACLAASPIINVLEESTPGVFTTLCSF